MRNDLPVCRVCKGSGEIREGDHPWDLIPEGDGSRYRRVSRYRCFNCGALGEDNGDRFLFRTYPVCPECLSTRHTVHPCKPCRGSGVVLVSWYRRVQRKVHVPEVDCQCHFCKRLWGRLDNDVLRWCQLRHLAAWLGRQVQAGTNVAVVDLSHEYIEVTVRILCEFLEGEQGFQCERGPGGSPLRQVIAVHPKKVAFVSFAVACHTEPLWNGTWARVYTMPGVEALWHRGGYQHYMTWFDRQFGGTFTE